MAPEPQPATAPARRRLDLAGHALPRPARERRVRRADQRLQRHRRDVQPDDLRQGDHRLRPLRRPAARRWPRAGSATRGSCSSRSRSTTSARPPACCARPTSTSGGSDGFISFECTPDLADDTEATIAQATDLWQRLDQPNVMIKVPGTAAGLPAIEELTRRGVNVNITLLFSVERYEQVIDAYLRGLSARADAGEPVDTITSVASFFLSRIDTKADAQLDPRTRPPAARSRSPAPASPTSATGPSSPAPAGSGCATAAPGGSGRCGRAPAPRTRPTPTCSTSPS